MKVLALSPHTDDAELGAGALLARLADMGVEVRVVAFSTGNPLSGATQEEMEAAAAVWRVSSCILLHDYTVDSYHLQRQKLLTDLEMMRDHMEPDLVLVPALGDPHQDHQTVTEEALRAWRWRNIRMLGYETLRARTAADPFRPTCYAPFGEEYWARKWAAVYAYESQRHNCSAREDVLRGLARVRGAQVGCQYAEAFEVLRWTL